MFVLIHRPPYEGRRDNREFLVVKNSFYIIWKLLKSNMYFYVNFFQYLKWFYCCKVLYSRFLGLSPQKEKKNQQTTKTEPKKQNKETYCLKNENI